MRYGYDNHNKEKNDAVDYTMDRKIFGHKTNQNKLGGGRRSVGTQLRTVA